MNHILLRVLDATKDSEQFIVENEEKKTNSFMLLHASADECNNMKL